MKWRIFYSNANGSLCAEWTLSGCWCVSLSLFLSLSSSSFLPWMRGRNERNLRQFNCICCQREENVYAFLSPFTRFITKKGNSMTSDSRHETWTVAGKQSTLLVMLVVMVVAAVTIKSQHRWGGGGGGGGKGEREEGEVDWVTPCLPCHATNEAQITFFAPRNLCTLCPCRLSPQSRDKCMCDANEMQMYAGNRESTTKIDALSSSLLSTLSPVSRLSSLSFYVTHWVSFLPIEKRRTFYFKKCLLSGYDVCHSNQAHQCMERKKE